MIKKWWRARRTTHLERLEAAVLGRLLLGDIYMLDIWKRLGGSSGDVHIALEQLQNKGLVWSAVVEQPGGMPRRRRFGLRLGILNDRYQETFNQALDEHPLSALDDTPTSG